LDAYDRKARLYPAAAAILPLSFLAVVLFAQSEWWHGLVGLVVAGGLHVAVISFVRDLGVAKQSALWESWGGPPTAVKLRWANATNDVLHGKHLAAVQRATGVTMPSRSQEQTDPTAAEDAYEAAVHILREKTQKAADYPRVKTEVTNYGYRRNLYGCRPLGIGVAILAVIAELGLTFLVSRDALDLSPYLLLAGVGVSVATLAVWIFWITPEFVRRDADRYAEALIAAASTVPPAS
jgi:hypothetical protein